MVKVIIVDDEILARIGIQSLLEHRKDISVEGNFGMPQDAIDFLRKHEIDIVITDIEMPEINGLEFTRMIQEEHLAQGIIILSCYDSFEYAQKAISLGIDSYLLKCDISQENLDRELDGVIEKISRKQRRTLNLTTEKELEDDNKTKVIGVMKMTGDKEEDQGILHERMVLLLLEEIIAKYHMGCLLESYKRSPFIVFQFSEKNQENWKDLLKEYVEIIVQNFFLYTNKKVYMGISSAFSDLQEIPERYRQAEEASEMRFYDEESSTFWAEDICWKAHVPGMMFSDESLLDEGGMEIFCQELSAYLQQCFSERVSVKTVKENLNRSVNMLIYSVLKAYIRDKETIQEWSSNVSFYEDLQKIATMNELKEKTIHCVERFREKLLDQLNDDYFQDFFRFIDEKLSEDLSLEDMADFNQQSISAFSKKFKEKTKMDAQKFYKKWIYDIADCQDSVSGHVQYTAPYIPSGGGPGGWGCAIVTVPYTYYKNYGDAEILKELYPQMLHWLDYMENHITTASGVISVKYDETGITVFIPKKTEASLIMDGKEYSLISGKQSTILK